MLQICSQSWLQQLTSFQKNTLMPTLCEVGHIHPHLNSVK